MHPIWARTCWQVAVLSFYLSRNDALTRAIEITNDDERTEQTIPSSDTSCTLYLAESSISNAGWGIYTSIPYSPGETIQRGEIIIPFSPPVNDDIPYFHDALIHDVTWNAIIYPPAFYETLTPYQDDPTVLFFPGMGAEVNSLPSRNNFGHGTPQNDSCGLHRSRDAGAGAFSYIWDMPIVANREIAAGEELFADYGEKYFTSRSASTTSTGSEGGSEGDVGGEVLGVMAAVPLELDYEEADEIMRFTLQRFERDELWRYANDETRKRGWNAIRHHLETEGKIRVLSALPERAEDLEEASDMGSAQYAVGGTKSHRSEDWLERNGICTDRLVIAASGVDQAGRGAFLKSGVKAGDVVSPMPVMQIDCRILHTSPDSDTQPRPLLTNYVMQHVDSDVCLVPYNVLVSYINHAPSTTRTQSSSTSIHPHANAELRWSTHAHLHHKNQQFHDLEAHTLLRGDYGFGLLMELVALRDMDVNEELFLDYGTAWEDAWERHVKQWKPPPPMSHDTNTRENKPDPTLFNENHYISASEYQIKIQTEQNGILRTHAEQQTLPYPPNLQTVCQFSHTDTTQYYSITKPHPSNQQTQTVYQTVWEPMPTSKNDCLRKCRILARHVRTATSAATATANQALPQSQSQTQSQTRYYYNVEILAQSTNLHPDCFNFDDENELVYVDQIPESAVMIMDVVDTRDSYLETAFRHPIGFPDGLLPKLWKR